MKIKLLSETETEFVIDAFTKDHGSGADHYIFTIDKATGIGTVTRTWWGPSAVVDGKTVDYVWGENDSNKYPVGTPVNFGR